MHIYVFQIENGEWVADIGNLPGTPVIGRGHNKYEAVGSLLFAFRHEGSFHKYIRPEFSITEVDTETAKSNFYRADTLHARPIK